MTRHQWKFRYAKAELLSAVETRLAYHEARLNEWSVHLAEAGAKLKESALTVRDYPVSGGSRMELLVDPALQKRFDECRERERHHREMVERFKLFQRTLPRGPEDFELDDDDILFFGL